MGKIRVKTFGDEELEKTQKEEEKKRKEAKLSAAKSSARGKTVKAPGMKGGERVVAVGPSEEELAAVELPGEKTEEAQKVEEKKIKKSKEKKAFQN